MPSGNLVVQVFQEDSFIPVENAVITITQGKEEGARQIEQKITTNSSGRTNPVELPAPPIENSMTPSNKKPYSLCDIRVEAKSFAPFIVKGCQIYPQNTALQLCNMKKTATRQPEDIIIVEPNTLVGNFPPKIPESPMKPLPPPPSGLVVLQEPVVPQFIVVHTGVPDDPSAPNYKVRFRDYIKNVASSEIFSTWSESTIRANILCILSFTLNRIYTEWYRGKGKNFDITNSTAYDHAFTYGRNIYKNIGAIVDELFTTYIKRPAANQPLLTQYCDGVKVQCPNWLTQWGSKYLGDSGKTPYEILTNFYGSNLSLVKADKVSGIPKSYPGYTLGLGATGQPVRTVQSYLNRISQNYPAIPKVPVNGVYGDSTRKAVLAFQDIFNLPQTGTVDYGTWYKISDVYVAVTKIAELRGEYGLRERTFMPPVFHSAEFEDIPTIDYFDDED